MSLTVREIMNGNCKFPFFSKLKGHFYAKTHQTITKFELDLRISSIYPYLKFELNVYYCWGDNERKFKISHFSQSERCITLPKIIEP
jgi:hypothetical protein